MFFSRISSLASTTFELQEIWAKTLLIDVIISQFFADASKKYQIFYLNKKHCWIEFSTNYSL